MTNEEKNYRQLVNKAELAFSEKRYLEAFLIQSCLFESVIKSFALLFLKSIFESHPNLRQKSNNFELARLVDELFIAGKINKKLYENLDNYRKKRNQVIHKILKFKDVRTFEKELRDTYKAGRDMKGFIVDQMVKSKRGTTSAELSAKLELSIKEITSEMHSISMRELKPMIRKLNSSLSKASKL